MLAAIQTVFIFHTQSSDSDHDVGSTSQAVQTKLVHSLYITNKYI